MNQQTDENGNPKPLTLENDHKQMGCSFELTGTIIENEVVEMLPSDGSEQTPNPVFDDLMTKKKKADMKKMMARAKQTASM